MLEFEFVGVDSLMQLLYTLCALDIFIYSGFKYYHSVDKTRSVFRALNVSLRNDFEPESTDRVLVLGRCVYCNGALKICCTGKQFKCSWWTKGKSNAYRKLLPLCLDARVIKK